MPPILDSRWHLFAKVAELGSLTKVALALNSPQSAISRTIGQLEKQCGGRLFRRTGRGVVLSDFGQEIYARIRPLIADADQLADDIQTTNGVAIGDVRVGVLPFAVPRKVSALIRAVGEQYPRIRLHLTEGSSAQLEELLDTGRLDLALLLREGPPTANADEPCLQSMALDLIGLSSDPILADGRIAFAALEGLPLILPGAPHVLRGRLDMLARERGVRLAVAIEADTIQLQREIAATGAGYAIVASSGAHDGERLGLGAARIVEPELLRSMVLATTRHGVNTLATRAMARLMVTIFSAK